MRERVRASTASRCCGVNSASLDCGSGAQLSAVTDGFGVLLEGEDGGDGVAGLEALLILGYLFGDDVFGGLRFPAAVGEVGLGDLLEIVDVVDEAAFYLVHAGDDVAGNGDVDEEHRAVAAALEKVLAVGAVEEFLGGTGAGDDYVGAVGLFVEGFVQG